MSAVSDIELTRARHKGSKERDVLDALLDEVVVGHVGVVRGGQPVVLPTAIARDGERVLLHGSTGSPWMTLAAGGAPICLEVTAMDALVVARSAFESGIRYRSAVLFGSCERLSGQAHGVALDLLTERLLPGRTLEVRSSSRRELAATMVLALPISQWSLKVSAGWPEDEATDVAGDAWAGVVPLVQSWGEPMAAPSLRPGIPVPESVHRLRGVASAAGQ